jgi:hypothetical protein
VLNPRIQSVLSDTTRTGAFSKLIADMNKFARLNLPDSVFKGVLGPACELSGQKLQKRPIMAFQRVSFSGRAGRSPSGSPACER